ncbi:MAG TPA: hypothetical protein VNL70_10850, partial [Tepidisphaeraceae bacterium]|nr:hypothetical protein [Tepidisphaeraceae bacterium]
MGRHGGQHRFAAATRTPTGTFRLEPLESRRLLSSITLVKPSADAYSVFEELLVSSDGQQAFFTMDDALWAADQSSVVKVGSISSAADLTLHGRWLYSRDLLGRLNLTDINTRQTWLISLPRAGVQVEQIFSLSNAVVVYGSDPADDFAPYFFIKRDSDAGFRTIANSGADLVQDFPLVFELNGQPHLLVGGDIKRIDFASDGSASATTIAQVQLLTGAATQVLPIGGALYINDGGWLRTKAVPGDAIGYSFVNPPLDFLGTAWFAEGQALYRVNPATGQAQPVVPFSPGVQQAVVSGNRIFILTPDGQVWMSNGTASGTVPVTALNGLRPTTLIPAPDGRVVVVAWNAARGNEFWLSDGTSGGTSIFDVSPGPADSSLGSFAFAGSNRIFFLADSTRGSGLFRADVTPGVNRAPVVAFKTAPRVLEGRTLTLDASATSDPDGDSLLFMWDLNGDGDFNDVVSTSPIVAVGWGRLRQLGISDGPATFSARVRAFDASAAGLSPLTPLSVLDAPPRVILSVPRQLLPNTDWTASFRFSDYGADTISSFVIDWGDGVLTRRRGSRATLTHRYSSTGTFSMRLITTDEDGTRSSPAIPIT